jgi:GNAT superfamily N-acetyltransferase
MIRLGTPADLPAAAGVYRRASLSNAGDRDNLLAHPEYLILGPEGLVEGRTYVAEEDGSVVGFATWAEAGGTIELEDLFVDPGWRRRGIATALVSRVVDVLRARGGAVPGGDRQPSCTGVLQRRRLHRLRRRRDGLRRRAPQEAGDQLIAISRFTVSGNCGRLSDA